MTLCLFLVSLIAADRAPGLIDDWSVCRSRFGGLWGRPSGTGSSLTGWRVDGAGGPLVLGFRIVGLELTELDNGFLSVV